MMNEFTVGAYIAEVFGGLPAHMPISAVFGRMTPREWAVETYHKMPVPKELISQNHLERLMKMNPAEFEELHGKWLSNYGFDGKYTASELYAGCPNKSAMHTYAVFQAARQHGFSPLGIVSKKSKRGADGVKQHITVVDGPRQYVGVALPFLEVKRSKFSRLPTDNPYWSIIHAADAVDVDSDDVDD